MYSPPESSNGRFTTSSKTRTRTRFGFAGRPAPSPKFMGGRTRDLKTTGLLLRQRLVLGLRFRFSSRYASFAFGRLTPLPSHPEVTCVSVVTRQRLTCTMIPHPSPILLEWQATLSAGKSWVHMEKPHRLTPSSVSQGRPRFQ